MASHALSQCFVINPHSSPLVGTFNACNCCSAENEVIWVERVSRNLHSHEVWFELTFQTVVQVSFVSATLWSKSLAGRILNLSIPGR